MTEEATVVEEVVEETPSAVATTPEETPPADPTPKLSKEQIVRAATNSPELSKTEFKLGDKTYKVVDLEYDQYLLFVSLLSPLLDAFISKLTNKKQDTISVPGINLPLDNISAGAVVKYCSQSLPEMVRIICSASDPDITIEEIKKRGKNPFKLATIAMLQIMQNQIIQDFADFFVQIAPLIRVL